MRIEGKGLEWFEYTLLNIGNDSIRLIHVLPELSKDGFLHVNCRMLVLLKQHTHASRIPGVIQRMNATFDSMEGCSSCARISGNSSVWRENGCHIA